MRITVVGIGFFSLWLILGSSHAQTVNAPNGWIDEMDGDVRVVRNGEAYIEFHPWESLYGQSVHDWLQDLERSYLAGAAFVSSNGLTKERVKGAYSITRKVKLGSKKGFSILYACPGLPGFVRIFAMEVPQSSFGKLVSGGLFAERVCDKEPRGRATEEVVDHQASELVTLDNTRDANASSETHIDTTPQPATASDDSRETIGRVKKISAAAANAQIPRQHRPSLVTSKLEKSFKGFPATLVYTATVELSFPNGYTTSCADWDPLTLEPTPESVGKKVKKCTVTEGRNEGKKVNAFEPGETVELKFGRVSASGFDWGSSSSTQLSGGSLIMTRDGRIAVGRYSFNSMQAGSNNLTSTRRSKALTGKYYLDGYTITIISDDGEVFHGFIGHTSNKNSRTIDHLYLNGTRYSNRDK